MRREEDFKASVLLYMVLRQWKTTPDIYVSILKMTFMRSIMLYRHQGLAQGRQTEMLTLKIFKIIFLRRHTHRA